LYIYHTPSMRIFPILKSIFLFLTWYQGKILVLLIIYQNHWYLTLVLYSSFRSTKPCLGSYQIKWHQLSTHNKHGLGRKCGGLYYMHPSKNKSTIFHVSQSFDLWHLRLGNPFFYHFKLMSHLLPNHPKELGNNCTICPKAKQTRLPFPKSSITTKFSFSLLHCDVWGHHKIPTHTGLRYLLTIFVDFSRCTWIFLMHHKLEQNFIN